MRLTWTSAVVAASMIGAPCSLAWAEERRAHGGYTPEAEQSRIGVEMDFLHTSGERLPSNVLASDLVAQIGVTRHVFIDADVSAAFIGSRGDSAGLFGNPMIGAHYAGRFDRRTSGFVGLRVGIPLAGASQPDFADQLAWYATTSRAWNDPYRFLPRVVPIVARAGLEVDLAPAFLRFALSPGLLPDLGGGIIAYTDAAATVGLRARFGLEGGLRGQGTFVIAIADDHAQTAIEPFIGYTTPERVGLYARYGLLVPLDEPLGIGGYGLATHRFSFGAKF